tara:strand:+ start:453 stop:713 length:261 start_codon:yes stop_codon:yes gene_type:complete
MKQAAAALILALALNSCAAGNRFICLNTYIVSTVSQTTTYQIGPDGQVIGQHFTTDQNTKTTKKISFLCDLPLNPRPPEKKKGTLL